MVVEITRQTKFCPECEGVIISLQQKGETVCQQCGLVLNEKELDISHSGIRAYSKQEKEKRERNGCPISILTPDIGLSTVIDRKKIQDPDLRRAVKWNTHLTWEKRNMLIAITELKRIGCNLYFPDYVKKAIVRLYRRTFKKNLLRGRSINGMIAACAYFICKQEKFPITFLEILNESSIDENNVKRCYKILIREMNLRASLINPILLIPRYCANLNLSIDVEKDVISVLNKFINNVFTCGKDPKGFCAGSIYLITKLKNLKISQKEIARTVGVTEVTLRSRYKEIMQHIRFSF